MVGAEGLSGSLPCQGPGVGVDCRAGQVSGQITLACWNMAGLYRSTSKLNIIANSGADIICLVETHLKNNQTITLDGFTWLGHNRLKLHNNAVRGSGGVGIL